MISGSGLRGIPEIRESRLSRDTAGSPGFAGTDPDSV